MSKYKKILVTGSTAVLGQGLKNISNDYKDYDFFFSSSKDCNLTKIDQTIEFVDKIKPDAIIHFAAISGGIGLLMKKHATILRDISLMNISILEAARINNIKKTIMTLTTGMYPADAKLPLDEKDIHNGYPHDTTYGSSFAKRIIDPAIRAYRDEFDLNVIGFIPSGIFGEEDNFNLNDAPMLPSLIRRFYEAKINGDEIVVWGDGSPLREYTYSQDLAKIFIWGLENYDDAQCLNIGTTEENSIKDIAYMICEIMEIDKKLIKFDLSKPKGVFRKNITNKKFIKLSNFKYTPFKEALKKTIEWFIYNYENNPENIRIHDKAR